jgi:hypothetical protein
MVAFLGNEYPASLAEGEAHQGLEALYLLLDDPENSALIYLELFEPPGAVAVHYRAAGKTAPLILLRTLALIAEGRRIPYALAPPARYVQGADQQPSPLALTLSRELPSLLVRAAGGAERDRLGADLLAGLFEEYAGLLEWNAGGLDAHYIPLTRRGKTVFITEWGILLMIFSGLGAGAGIVLLYSAFRHHIAIPGRVDFFGNAAICAAIGGLFWAVCIDITRAAGCIGVLFFIAIGGVLPFPRGVFICAGCALLGTAGTLVISLRGQDAGVFTQTLFLLIAALLLALRGGLLIHNKAERRAAAGTAGSLDAGPPARNQRRPLGRR